MVAIVLGNAILCRTYVDKSGISSLEMAIYPRRDRVHRKPLSGNSIRESYQLEPHLLINLCITPFNLCKI